MNPGEDTPVFYDPAQRRAGHLQRTALLVTLLLAALFTLFWASVIAVPMAHRLHLAAPRYLPDNPAQTALTTNPPEPAARRPRHHRAHHHSSRPIAVPGKADGVVGGFYVSWDQVSLASLRQHAGQMTHLFPGWLHLNPRGDGLTVTDSDRSDVDARRIAREHHLKVLPLVNNFRNSDNSFDGARLHAMLSSPTARQQVAQALLDYVQRNGCAGVNLDFESDTEEDRAALADFAQEVATLFHPRGLLVTACTQLEEGNESAAMARSCDFVVPMLYDLHWSGGDAGPIAPRRWTEEQLTTLLATVPANKIVIAIGNYAYDWERGKTGAKSLTFGEAMVAAHESLDPDGSTNNGVVRFDAAAGNPRFSYEEDGTQHDVWILDAVTAYNLLRFARAKGVTGRALWYVGSEDPSLWTFFATGKAPTDSDALGTVRYGWELAFEGEGEALDVTTLPEVGQRVLHADTSGYLINETFTKYPTACIVRRSGRRAKQIALTFDDGPDPRWTPRILDALGAAHVPATFFVIGVNAQQHPDLVQREWREGHLIGNHSFYHPNLAQVSPERARLEIGATERAIQAAILRSTNLFRPPYGIDVEPSTTEEVVPLIEAEKLGYVTVGEGIDPQDWQIGAAKRTAAQIAAHVLESAESGNGNVVLLHDSGGSDRSETIKAIPLIVAQLRAHGFQIVSLSDLIGHPRADLMPTVTGRERTIALLDRCVFALTTSSGNLLGGLFLISLVAGTIRMAVTAVLALRGSPSPIPSPASQERGQLLAVSVVIAAYNEEKVVARTIHALLDGGYPNLEVIVVDDGSKDDTSGVVRRHFAGEERVRLIVKPNGGKASALNLGIMAATGEILIGLDADTLFAPDTVQRLVRHFADPSVGAVAGNIQVGNRSNWITRWQAVEYTTSQNFDRRAYAVLNAIPVVPGCVGAWRKAAVDAAGLYQRDTLAEDADLTWRVRKLGWRIVCDNTALAYTEVPERLSELMKQRFRWTFGTLQVLWKHRGVLFRPRYGWFGMAVVPSLWLFQVVLPLAAPAADLGVVLTVFSKNWPAACGYGAFFFVTELSAALLAFHLDGATAERRRDLRLLFVQRFVYRYVMFAVLLRAVLAAVQGVRAGWGKLDRRGTAVAPPSSVVAKV